MVGSLTIFLVPQIKTPVTMLSQGWGGGWGWINSDFNTNLVASTVQQVCKHFSLAFRSPSTRRTNIADFLEYADACGFGTVSHLFIGKLPSLETFQKIHPFWKIEATLRGALLDQICSFFEHCSKSLWPPPPFVLNIMLQIFWWIS